MSEYKFFATVYDRMMDDIPYDFWEQYLLQILYRNNVSPDASITEIGCGTGTMTQRLADYGFHMTGIDLSEDMLKEARKKQRVRLFGNRDTEKQGIKRQDAEKQVTENLNSWHHDIKHNIKRDNMQIIESIESNLNANWDNQNTQEIPYIQMDMRELKLPEKQDVIVSVCDSMNYLLTNDDLYRTMKSVRDNLKNNGLFIFDLKTEHLFMTQLDGYAYRENRGDFSYVWTNRYDRENHIHTYYLKFKHFEEDVANEGKKGFDNSDNFYGSNNRDNESVSILGRILKRKKTIAKDEKCRVLKIEEEEHKQRAFFASDIKEAALKAGFKSAKVFDAGSFTKPLVSSERIYVVLKNQTD